MNHTYRLVWNSDSQRYVPAPECAKGKTKSKSKSQTRKALAPAAVLLSAAFAMPAWAQAPPANIAANALPTGGQVAAGQANISQTGNQMTVNQATNKAIIDWSSFNIGKDAGVTFQQNNANSIALNRVTAGDASQIHGQLNANGQVWLINPNGVVFGAGSKVDVGGLVATTMNISNADFENGNYKFSRNGATGSIVNQGEITAKDGGYIALLAPTVSNDGIIRAQLGTVAMAAGDQITLQAGANGLLNVQVDPATLRTLIENKQLIVADGGQVIMTGKAADALAASVVSNTGTIQANSLQEKDGKILLIADMKHGETKAAGTLEAKFIDTSAATVSIDKDLKVNTHGGEWLIDPVDIIIDSAKAGAIGSALSTGDVTVSTADNADNTAWEGGTNSASGSDAGDIHVNADITSNWSYKLTLNANRNINLNAVIYLQGSSKLAMNYGGTAGDTNATPAAGSGINAAFGANGGFAGKVVFGTSISQPVEINGDLYTVIKTMASLASMGSSLNGKYVLGADLDAQSENVPNFFPIGSNSAQFTGIFDGLGHTIKNLAIDRGQNYVGLFGSANNATLRNVGLESSNIKGLTYVGALAGALNGNSSVSQAYATTEVLGRSGYVGGLVGRLAGSSSIRQAYVTGQVSSGPGPTIGGLVGLQTGSSSISQAYATAKVSGGNQIGGLVGKQDSGSIRQAYATGEVSSAGIQVGGLVGEQTGSSSEIIQAYATGKVSGNNNVGGLVGTQGGSVSQSYYATTDANGSTINNGGAAGGVWSGNSGSGIGKTWAELADTSTFTDWGNMSDTANPWAITAGRGAAVAGYELGSLPTLRGITRTADVQSATLFDGGMGTEASAWGISSWGQLASMGRSGIVDGGYHFALKENLSSSTAGYAALAGTGANNSLGWTPIGDSSAAFTGTFDGQNHTISNLTINNSEGGNIGLFGQAENATLRNVGLEDVNITGYSYVGALVGSQAANGAGKTASISNAYATGQVNGMQYVGGLVGFQGGAGATISNAYADVAVNTTNVGEEVGGLAGRNSGNIRNAYAAGAVKGENMVGGLVGQNSGSIANAYASGTVTATHGPAALVSFNNSGTISDSFWDAASNWQGVDYDTTNGNSITNTASKTAAQLKEAATFADWDMANTGGSSKVWRIYEGRTGPLLRSFLTAVTVTGRTGGQPLTGKTYDGTAASANAQYDMSDINVPGAVLLGTLAYTTTGKNAATYSTTDNTLTLGGLYSSKHDISFVHDSSAAAATLTITPKALTVSGTTVAGKTYDGSTSAALSGGTLAGVLANDTVTLSGGTGSFDNKNVGTGKTVTASGFTLAGADAGNYTVTAPTGLSADITPKALSASLTGTVSKTNDGTTAATVSGSNFNVTGWVAGEGASITQTSAAYDDASTGTGKTVTASLSSSHYNADDGTNLSNYTLATTASGAVGVITAAAPPGPNPDPGPDPDPGPPPPPPPPPAPTPSPTPTPSPAPNPAPSPGPAPEPAPSPEPAPEPSPGPAPAPEPSPGPAPEPAPSPSPSPSPAPSPGPAPSQAQPQGGSFWQAQQLAQTSSPPPTPVFSGVAGTTSQIAYAVPFLNVEPNFIRMQNEE